jgi:hypothetical protein
MNSTKVVLGSGLILIGMLQLSAQQVPAGASTEVPGRTAAPRLLPGTRADVVSSIRGTALDSTGGTLPKTAVRLRDARGGRIVDSQITDSSGAFAFTALDPGSYIVEVIGTDQSVLAASQLLNVNAGEAVSAVVKLAFRIPPFAGILGNSAASAAAVLVEAAAAGVLATTISGQPATPGPK